MSEDITRDRYAHHDWIPDGQFGVHLFVPVPGGGVGERRRLVPPAEALSDPQLAGEWLLGWVAKIREAGR